ncbi:hypothetical protein AJ87_45765 [Rhizobium yanglingense]|nr:hypothetical protein AJ87_45765 [Rhizobium yanglingense]
MTIVGGIDREFLGPRWNDHAFVGLYEYAATRGKDEDVRAAAEAENQRKLRAVDEKAGGELGVSPLEEGGVRLADRITSRWEDGEDRPDADVYVDVRGAVQRIDGDCKRSFRIEERCVFEFLGGVEADRRLSHRVDEEGIGQDVEILCYVAAWTNMAAFSGKGLAGRTLIIVL